MMNAKTSGDRVGSNDPPVARGVDADVACQAGKHLPLISFSPKDDALGVHDPGVAHAVDVDSNCAAVDTIPLISASIENRIAARGLIRADQPDTAIITYTNISARTRQGFPRLLR